MDTMQLDSTIHQCTHLLNISSIQLQHIRVNSNMIFCMNMFLITMGLVFVSDSNNNCIWLSTSQSVKFNKQRLDEIQRLFCRNNDKKDFHLYRWVPISPCSSSAAHSSDPQTHLHCRSPKPPPPSQYEHYPSLWREEERENTAISIPATRISQSVFKPLIC